MENTLQHHGILGMKWGVRRYQNADGTLTAAGKARKNEKKTDETTQKDSSKSSVSGSKSSSTTKKLNEMTDAELKEKINRLQLEKQYKELSSNENQVKISRGKKFVVDVLEASGKNIATQAVTYAMGTAVNKAVGSDIVNPKKGQKDK